jgi:hypothetical protein
VRRTTNSLTKVKCGGEIDQGEKFRAKMQQFVTNPLALKKKALDRIGV